MYKNKYNVANKEARTYKGIIYDSLSEKLRAIYLENEEKNGRIEKLERQKPFILLDDFFNNGKKIKGIKYIADFVYIEKGKIIVEDVKSKITAKRPDYIIKKKLFMNKYPEYIFKEFFS